MQKLFNNEVNFIKYVLTHPCADPYFIFIETFIECLPELAVNLLWFTDLGNIGEAAGRAVMPGKVGRRRGHLAVKAVVEEDKGLLNKITLKWLKGAMWIMEPLDAIGSFFLVYFAVDQLFYRWHSLLIERDYCSSNPNTGPLQMISTDVSVLFTATGDTPPLTAIRQNRAGWSTSPFTVTTPDGNFDFIFAVKGHHDNPALSTACWVRFVVTSLFGVHTYDSNHQELPPNGDFDMICHAHFFALPPVGATVTWQFFTSGTIVQAQHCDLRLIAMSRPFF
jgi:hypothetical protein